MRSALTVLGWLLSLATLGSAQTVPDFHLNDVNLRSARYGRLVSPRDYRQQISAYYFGLAG